MQWHTIEIRQEDLDLAARVVQEQVANIQSEKTFAPQPNRYCGSCDFLPICPARNEIQVMIDQGTL